MTGHHRDALVDYERTCWLCDQGNTDYIAAVCVTADGEDLLWLVSKDELDAEHPRCGSADQPHEQLGALPLEVVRRITVSARTHRCGRRTKSGTPCRAPVARPGDACVWHKSGQPA